MNVQQNGDQIQNLLTSILSGENYFSLFVSLNCSESLYISHFSNYYRKNGGELQRESNDIWMWKDNKFCGRLHKISVSLCEVQIHGVIPTFAEMRRFDICSDKSICVQANNPPPTTKKRLRLDESISGSSANDSSLSVCPFAYII